MSKNLELCCIHKYLTKCKSVSQPPGWGDFLRGTVALYNYAKLYNYTLFIDASSHPIFNFFVKNKYFINDSNNETVHELLPPLSYNEIDLKLKDLFEKYQSFSIITNAFYSKVNNEMVNYGEINDSCKIYLKELLQPCDLIINRLEYIYKNIYNIDQDTKYKVIHLRLGDDYIHNDIVDGYLLEYLSIKISNLINNNPETKFILLSDSSNMAIQIKQKCQQLLYWENKKIHIGDLKNHFDGLLDTVIDFFIIAKANDIYVHNFSGFSHIASLIYNINYVYL
jgi:hypothetical protein